MKLQIRNLAVVASVVFAIAVPVLQMGLDMGLSAKEFAGPGSGCGR